MKIMKAELSDEMKEVIRKLAEIHDESFNEVLNWDCGDVLSHKYEVDNELHECQYDFNFSEARWDDAIDELGLLNKFEEFDMKRSWSVDKWEGEDE